MLRLLRTREAIRALYQSHRPAGHRGAGRLQGLVGNFISQDFFIGLLGFMTDRLLEDCMLTLANTERTRISDFASTRDARGRGRPLELASERAVVEGALGLVVFVGVAVLSSQAELS